MKGYEYIETDKEIRHKHYKNGVHVFSVVYDKTLDPSTLLNDSEGIAEWNRIRNQPERTECSKREDSYQQLSTEYLNGKEHWETDPSERISIQCFASWLDRRCGTLNTEEL